MYKIVAIMGKAGSGKDSLMKAILHHDTEKNLNEIISYTTRPIREGEQEGINYHYVSNEEFSQLVLENKMLEATVFNSWGYGTAINSLNENKINIGVFNPAGIESLMKDSRINLKVFYIEASDKERLIRQLSRESDPNIEEIFRRFKADEIDFSDLSDFNYTTINNEIKKDFYPAVYAMGRQIRDWADGFNYSIRKTIFSRQLKILILNIVEEYK